MTRCNSCNGILTKTDVECFVCGEPVPGARRHGRSRPKAGPAAELARVIPVATAAQPAEPKAKSITPVSNLVFLGSLVLTAFSFLSAQKLTVALSLGLLVILLSIRILDGRVESKDSSQNCH